VLGRGEVKKQRVRRKILYGAAIGGKSREELEALYKTCIRFTASIPKKGTSKESHMKKKKTGGKTRNRVFKGGVKKN